MSHTRSSWSVSLYSKPDMLALFLSQDWQDFCDDDDNLKRPLNLEVFHFSDSETQYFKIKGGT